MRHLLLIILLISLSATSGCSWFSKTGLDGDKDSDADKWSQGKLYKEAKDALNAGSWHKSIEYYEKLQARHPFGADSEQAQLDLAYAYYKEEEPVSAVAACERFMKLNPNHPHVDYAYYLKGLANFSQGKGLAERFLPVDATQRDQAAAMKSFEDFEDLTKRFPRSEYVEDAQKRMMYLRNILAQHEVHVANYYMRRGAYVAAANRARYVIENYERAPAVPEALMIMAKAYRILELDELSADALRVLESNFPNHPGLEEVRAITLR
jgi:outer membrane protein assembly factor BamD